MGLSNRRRKSRPRLKNRLLADPGTPVNLANLSSSYPRRTSGRCCCTRSRPRRERVRECAPDVAAAVAAVRLGHVEDDLGHHQGVAGGRVDLLPRQCAHARHVALSEQPISVTSNRRCAANRSCCCWKKKEGARAIPRGFTRERSVYSLGNTSPPGGGPPGCHNRARSPGSGVRICAPAPRGQNVLRSAAATHTSPRTGATPTPRARTLDAKHSTGKKTRVPQNTSEFDDTQSAESSPCG